MMTACQNPARRGAFRRLCLAAACAATALIVTAGSPSAAKAAGNNAMELKTERVIVFKDGYCLVVKRGAAVTDAAGEFFTEQVPDAAVLGSFWATPKEGKLLSLRAGWEKTTEKAEKSVPCMQTIEILKANEGKQCKVELSDKTTYSGIIRKVLVQETESPVPDTARESLGLPVDWSGDPRLSSRIAVPRSPSFPLAARASDSTRTEKISGIAGTRFVLRAQDGDVLLPVDQVRTLTIGDMKTDLKQTVTVESRSKRLTFRFAEAQKEHEVLVMYFRPGLRWVPTYRIELSGDGKNKKANLSLQAELINEMEDLADVPVDIVVGVPNFRFRDTPSPLVLEATMRNALNQAAPQLMGQFSNGGFSNAMMTQRAADFNPAPMEGAGAAAVNLPAELTAGGSQDLFVYNLPKLKFRKGERVAVPILSTESPYRDVYTWDLRLKRRDIEAAPSAGGSPLVLSKNEVWHQVELTNNTKFPWTTGAAMLLEGRQPLAQELLTYTPPGSAVRVPVTVSVDTRGTFFENEIARDLKALTWDGWAYVKITKQATLDLHNSKAIPVETEITVRLGGRVETASHDGVVTLSAFDSGDWENYQGSPAVNNNSTVRWTVTLKPGESFKPTVKYFYYTRHQ
jgi:hypothetical protein